MLIEASENPVINMCNASFGSIVCHARQLTPLYLLPGWRDRSLRRILESYHPDSHFVYTTAPRFLFGRLLAAVSAFSVWRKLKTPRDILDFRVDGLKFGDIVYDNVLVKGYATIQKVNLDVLCVLYAFFQHRQMINYIIRRYPLDSFVVSHTIGMFGGTFSRYLLKHQIEVLNRIGSHEILVQKYRSSADVGFYPVKPEWHHFEYLMNLPDDVVLPLANAYLDERHNQQISHLAVELAFNKNKRIYDDRDQFCRVKGFDPTKKLAFVMLHAFNDHPHSHFSKPLEFQDYFDWFERTLRVAQTVDSVNWVFKEHPAAAYYRTKDVDLHAIFGSVSQPNIIFLDADADFNALSIRFLADAIVTCLGTAGMEYACVGIPCLLGGESPYSGFGFAIEPHTVADYEALLRGLDKIGRLTPEQMKAAKIVTYFELSMLNRAQYLFCPQYDYRQIAAMSSSKMLADAADWIRRADVGALNRQVDVLSEFVKDSTRTQFIDFDCHPYMRGVISY